MDTVIAGVSAIITVMVLTTICITMAMIITIPLLKVVKWLERKGIL